jgi:DNA-binding beta-propeller fold protein YncE
MKSAQAISILLCMALPGPLRAQKSEPLRLVETIPLSNVEGRIDHFSIDLDGGRLFMAALGNNTVEVFDLKAGRRVHSISGLHEPQGVRFVEGLNKLFVANGEDGTVRIFDGITFKELTRVSFGEDADNLRYDSATRRIYVGYGPGGLGVIDAQSGKRLGNIKLDGHPESFQLEKGRERIFVNLPSAQCIVVIDRTEGTVIDRWPLPKDGANFPMALDEADHRLFVACRRPAELLVLDAASGKIVDKIPCVGDADDLWYDVARRRLYITGGEGAISVIAQRHADHYETLARIPTAGGARTSFFAPQLNRLYLAVPHRGSHQAELRVYEAIQ